MCEWEAAMRNINLIIAAALISFASIGAAYAQAAATGSRPALSPSQGKAYPNRPLRAIVPIAPGGGTDTMGRLVTTRLSEVLGQQIVVDNRAGGGGTIGVSIAAQLPYIKAGRVRALAVTTAKRNPQLPDVPTMNEAGIPGYEVTIWYAVFVPAGVPKPIVARLNSELVTLLNSPEMKERMAQFGVDAAPSTPEELAAFVKSETIKWTKTVQDAGVKLE